jgi:diacylglycerol kinase (ATP)
LPARWIGCGFQVVLRQLNDHNGSTSSQIVQNRCKASSPAGFIFQGCEGVFVINKPNGSGLGRILKATECSRKGFVAAWRFEAAFRQEALLAMLMLPLSFWLAQSVAQWALLVAVLLLVLIVELLNSAIEALTDRVSLERHELSGRAKDMGSAAVTLSLTIVALVWGAALWQRLML